MWRTMDFALWGLLGAVWLIAAPFSRKTVRRESIASRARFLLPALIAAVLMGAGRVGVAWLDARWLPEAAWSGALSVGMTAAGVAFAVWARHALGRNWSGTVTLKEGHRLIRTGPYAISR